MAENIESPTQEINTQEMTMPDVFSFRKVVDKIENRRDRVLIKVLYLIAGRTSEVCTLAGAYDLQHGKSRDYGTWMKYEFQDFKLGDVTEKVLLVKVATAKRRSKDGKIFPRYVPVSCNPLYEPWCLDLLEWIRDHGNLNFPLHRWTVSTLVKKNLKILGEDVHAHSLRHWRCSHCINDYNMDPADISSMMGWTFRTGWNLAGFQTNPMISIYQHVAWKRYFPRLCLPISKVAKIA